MYMDTLSSQNNQTTTAPAGNMSSSPDLTEVMTSITTQDSQNHNLFGANCREKHFLLDSNIINFNHGSFGTVPKQIMEKHISLLYEPESCPETWFRERYFTHINAARESISNLIRSKSVNDVVLVENASYAVNAILRSFPFHTDDEVLVFSSAYRMVKDVVRFQEHYQQIKLIEVPIYYPLATEQELIDDVKAALNNHPNVKMCIFSHISSMVKPSCALINGFL